MMQIPAATVILDMAEQRKAAALVKYHNFPSYIKEILAKIVFFQ